MYILAATAGLGCPASDTRDDSARVPAPDTTTVAAATPWYDRTRALDLTSDGRADSIRLVASGTRPDSLSIALSFIVGGEQKHVERWGSSYELTLVDSAVRVSPRVDTLLRAKLDSVLASVVVQRLDAPGVQLMAEDSAAFTALNPRPTHRISFAYGYESTTRLVWDSAQQRFVRLWSCC